MSNTVVKPFMSSEEFKALGVMGRMPRERDAFERSGPQDDGVYDGDPSVVDHVAARRGLGDGSPERSYQAHVYVGGARGPLGNPNHNSTMDDFEASNSHFAHLATTLATPGKERLKLVQELARAGNKVALSAGEIDRGFVKTASYADAAQDLRDRFTGKRAKNEKTRSMTEEEIDLAASEISGRGVGAAKASPNWTAIGPTPGVAKLMRGAIDASLEQFPPDANGKNQTLPKTEADVDFGKLSDRIRELGKPARFRETTFEMKGGKQKKADGTIAVFGPDHMNDAMISWMDAQSPRIAFLPQKSPALWKKLIDRKNYSHWRDQAYHGAKNDREAMEKVVNKADAVTVFVDYSDMRTLEPAAYAYRQGKLFSAFDLDGRKLPLHEIAKDATSAHMSKAEYARSMTAEAFNVEAGSTEGRFYLSLVKSEKLGVIPEKDINKLAMAGLTLNEAADSAMVDVGKEFLREEIRVGTKTIALLGDENVMSNARTEALRQRRQMGEHGVEMVDPSRFSAAHLASGRINAVIFAQGDVDLLARADTIVGVVGDTRSDPDNKAFLASKQAPALAALATSTAVIAEIEGETSMEIPVTGPRILILGSGHAHASGKSPEATLARRAEILEKGGVILSTRPPVEDFSILKQIGETKDASGRVKKLWDRESSPSTHNEAGVRSAARLLGQMSDAALITQMSATEKSSAAKDVLSAHLTAGRRPAVINFNEAEGFPEVSGNRALLMARGDAALVKAGFGVSTVESLGRTFEGARVALDAGKNPGAAMENLIRHAKGEELVLPKTEKTRARQADQR